MGWLVFMDGAIANSNLQLTQEVKAIAQPPTPGYDSPSLQ
jgi:hypothetical protein